MSYSAMLTDEITVEDASGKDDYGEPSYINKRAIKARIENESTIVTDNDGREKRSDHKIATMEVIHVKDRIWLPGTDTTIDAEARRPIRIESASTPSGSFTVFMTYL